MTTCGACVAGTNPWHDGSTHGADAAGDDLPPNTCPACLGKGTLPGRNFVVQGYVDPNCWHCNGQGVIAAPTQPKWAKADKASRIDNLHITTSEAADHA